MHIHGNTHVTRHGGVPSCGQRSRNVFTSYLFTYLLSLNRLTLS